MIGDLSTNFDRSEFRCHCGCDEFRIDWRLIQALQALRDQIGKPIKINSGFRCPAYNASIGGASNSQHIQGRAADCVVDGMTPEEVAEAAKRIAAFYSGGIGLYKGFTHLDVRAMGPARWDYRNN